MEKNEDVGTEMTDETSKEVHSPHATADEALDEQCKISDDSALENSQEVTIVQPIREDLVGTAVHFLLNPRVKGSPLAQRREFLLRKGLTSVEIDAAIERATSGQLYSPAQVIRLQNSSSVLHPNETRPPYTQHWVQNDPSIWAVTRTLVPSIAIVAGVVYGIYLFYKRYLEPRLFGSHKHPLVIIQENVLKLTDSMNNLKDTLLTIESNIKQQIESEITSHARPSPAEIAAINDIKAEVQSLKALLLNREQFPAAPKVKASIPSWQLSDDVKASAPRDESTMQ